MQTHAKRIQRRRSRGWRMPDRVVYVGRPTKWGNPFKVGDANGSGIILKTPSMVVDEYRRYLRDNMTIVIAAQRELRGKDLACWCKPGEPCHADVLIELANP